MDGTVTRLSLAIIGLAVMFVGLQLISPEWFVWLYARKTICKVCHKQILERKLEAEDALERHSPRGL